MRTELFPLTLMGVVLLAVTATHATPPREPDWIARGKSEMVATDSQYASKAGLTMLEAGGNAIDAAVAASFALAVTRPYSTGLGGGGFLIARLADGRVIVQDFRETAPAASTADMFVKAREKNPEGFSPSEFGYLGVAVPGLVAGRCQALAQWGTLPLEKVLQPAIALAREGYPVDDDYVRTTKEVLGTYEKHPVLKELGSYVFRLHLNGGKLHAAGDLLVQPELARLLEGIANGGADFFYKGQVADDLVRAMQRGGGIITKADLAGYQVKLREPIYSTYRDYKLILMPPPSSGGIALAQICNILECFPRTTMPASLVAFAEHLQIEAMKHAFADRATWLGDQDYVDVPVGRLLSKEYARTLADRIQLDHVAQVYGSAQNLRDAGTSHFCVVDRLGNAVVSTETINTSFGSLTAVEEWGLILNNEMDDFTAQPGVPNAFGLVQAPANSIAPGKRPLSSMSPTIILRDGQPFLLAGASGGPRIISSVLNVSLLAMDLGLPLRFAVENPRPHHQWQPDMVFFDRPPTKEIKEALEKRGHKISDKTRTGIVQAIMRDGDEWVGASDPRKGGKPARR